MLTILTVQLLIRLGKQLKPLPAALLAGVVPVGVVLLLVPRSRPRPLQHRLADHAHHRRLPLAALPLGRGLGEAVAGFEVSQQPLGVPENVFFEVILR